VLQVADFKDPGYPGICLITRRSQVQILPPLPISPVFLDKLDTYRRRYKSGAAGAARNIVGIAYPRKRVDAEVLLRSCGTVLSLLDSSS
jgi:hypothetical protein